MRGLARPRKLTNDELPKYQKEMTNVKNPAKSAKSRVLIVDDHPIMRVGLATLINGQSDLVVCGEAENGHEALQAVNALKPDLAIVDITLEGIDGIELTKRIRRRDEHCTILVLSMHDETIYAERALRAGARGYIMKQEARGNLLKAIRKVLADEIWVSEVMANRIMSKFVAGGEMVAESPVSQLSDRELEVFTLIGRGRRSRAIAEALSISVRTVDAHRERIKKKLNLEDATALIRYAIEWENNEAGFTRL